MIRMLAVAAALSIPGAALAQTHAPLQTHAPSQTRAPAAPTTSAAPTPAAQTPAPATAEAVGRIEAVDDRAGTITLHHAPIAALGWPAMTMTFKAAPAALQAARAGRTVRFTLELADRTVTAIAPN